MAALSSSFSLFSLPRIHPIRSLPRITTCFSSSSSSSSSSPPTEFHITFAPPKPKPKPPPNLKSLDINSLPANGGGQFIIPWIVRGEDGKIKMQAHPPAHLINALADASTQVTKKKKDKEMKKLKKKEIAAASGGSSEPKLSKAARRYYNENIKDLPQQQRLSKVLAAAGVSSRRGSEELIFNGKVTVNGTRCDTPQTRVDPAKDIIYVNGNRLPKMLPPKVYLAINKPKGYICSSGEKEFKSVIELFADYFKGWGKMNPGIPRPRLFTVGRLDVATTGLLIVTNDGDFSQKLSHPSSMLKKEYIAVIDGAVKTNHLIAISKGTIIDGVHCTPDSVELMPRQPEKTKSRLRIVVHEGRNHEVRELVKNAGLELYSLKRVKIGGFRLPPDLGLGKYVELKQTDLRALGWKSS